MVTDELPSVLPGGPPLTMLSITDIQTLADDRDERGVGRRRTDAEQANYRHGALLLRARRERPGGCRAAECDQQFPPSDADCHTLLPCEVRKGRIPRHERAVPNTPGRAEARLS